MDALSAGSRRPLWLIAESDQNDPRLVTPREAGGLGIHGQWSDDFHHSVHVALTGETTGYYADFERLDALAKVLARGFFHDGTWSSFREREHGAPIDVDTFAGWRLVVATQNHDQIGNRAAGDRLSETLDRRALALAAVLLMTSRVHADAVHGRGVGRIDAVAVLHLAPGARARSRDGGGSHRRVREDGVGPGASAGSAGSRPPSRAPGSTGPSSSARSMPTSSARTAS